MIDDILKFKKLNKLKSVYRLNSVDDRHESTAEHTWSSLMLADYFIEEYAISVDRARVFQLILYHDLIEIKVGDTPLHPNIDATGKKRREEIGAKALFTELPKHISQKYKLIYGEYENQTTIEARFAKAVDVLDPMIHELDYKDDWDEYTEDFLRSKKEKHLIEFPKLKELFDEILHFMDENGYFIK